MVKAIYAGSFDPITNGHLWMIEQGSSIFDNLVVAIGNNPEKKTTFSVQERISMISDSTRRLDNISFHNFEGKYLVDYAASIGAKFILRGVRNGSDYEYERGMRYINSDLNPAINTIFMMPPREMAEVSSSLVKGLIGSEGWEMSIRRYIPRSVYTRFLIKHNGLKKRFDSLLSRIGKVDPENMYNEILDYYGKERREGKRFGSPTVQIRKHHNIAHIADMLGEFDTIKSDLDNPDSVEAAIWYHDAIYDSSEKNNEEESMCLMKESFVKIEVPDDFIENTGELILVTKHDKKPLEKDAMYLVDLDLSILGKPEREFDEYERNIRDEYFWVDEDDFRAGRKRLLQSFLDRESIYSTDTFKKRFEDQARVNISRSIKKL